MVSGVLAFFFLFLSAFLSGEIPEFYKKKTPTRDVLGKFCKDSGVGIKYCKTG